MKGSLDEWTNYHFVLRPQSSHANMSTTSEASINTLYDEAITRAFNTLSASRHDTNNVSSPENPQPQSVRAPQKRRRYRRRRNQRHNRMGSPSPPALPTPQPCYDSVLRIMINGL